VSRGGRCAGLRAAALWAAPLFALSSGSPASGAAPLEPLPSLPSVSRVRIEATEGRVLVLEDVSLPRGDWRGGDLELYVAFGAPGAPRAFDARLYAAADGALEPDEADAGEPVPTDRAPRRPATAHPLLGRPQMAGAVLHVREPAFKKAVTPGGMAILRVRTILDAPPDDPERGREVVVRLGASNGQPLTLGRIQVVTTGPKLRIRRAEAHLCGPDADTYPLALSPKPPASAVPQERAPIAPVLAVRHASDDLCVLYAMGDAAQ
jgi:hypothetical protein